jgi:hypothetical protein
LDLEIGLDKNCEKGKGTNFSTPNYESNDTYPIKSLSLFLFFIAKEK